MHQPTSKTVQSERVPTRLLPFAPFDHVANGEPR
jgi:hypothetical protein